MKGTQPQARSHFLAVAAVLSAIGPAIAASQDVESEEIVVERTRLEVERRVHAYVTAITHRGYAVEPLARWIKPICPLVAGLPSVEGEFILEAVSQAALAAGAPLAPGKCRPNFLVVLTSEPDELLRLWPRRAPRLFGGAPPAAVRRAMGQPRPIRVWYNVQAVCADGVYAATQANPGNLLSTDTMAGSCPLRDSRLARSHVNSVSSVLVIVDLDEIRETPLGPLTDYIAMVGMAKVDLDGAWGDAPTVLRLFVPPGDAAHQRMSVWDQAFLKALYRTSPTSRSQRSAIAQTMLRDLEVL